LGLRLKKERKRITNSGGGVANCSLNQMRAAGRVLNWGQEIGTVAGQLKEKCDLEEEEFSGMEDKEISWHK
jgi:hypothetical protein